MNPGQFHKRGLQDAAGALTGDDELREVAKAEEAVQTSADTAKKAVKQIYDGACARMGVKSVIEMKDFNLTELVKQS